MKKGVAAAFAMYALLWSRKILIRVWLPDVPGFVREIDCPFWDHIERCKVYYCCPIYANKKKEEKKGGLSELRQTMSRCRVSLIDCVDLGVKKGESHQHATSVA